MVTKPERRPTGLPLTLQHTSGLLNRKPHDALPEALSTPQITQLLLQPLRLHDMQVTHLTVETATLTRWLQKGGELRVSLNGIEFALVVVEITPQHQLAIRDISQQSIDWAYQGCQTTLANQLMTRACA